MKLFGGGGGKVDLPVSVIGALVNPQNLEFWGEPWLLPNALNASGLSEPFGNPDGSNREWSMADDQGSRGDLDDQVFQTIIRSPDGNDWTARYWHTGNGVQYAFIPVNAGASEMQAEALALSRCCEKRGGCL